MGTVTDEFSSFFCMTMWLPRRRTSENPWAARILQIALPERTRSLGNRDLELRHIDLVMKPFADLLRGGGFEEKLQRLLQIRPGLPDAVALAGDVQLGTKGDVAVTFPLDDCCQVSGHRLNLSRAGDFRVGPSDSGF